MRIAATVIALIAVTAASGTSAQEKPADPAQIAEAIEACKAITSPTWVDLRQLRTMGWDNFTKSTGTRQMKIAGAYAKQGNPVLIVAGHDELKAKTCMVFARLGSTGQYNATAQGVSTIIGMPTGQREFTYIWEQDGHRLTLDPSGDKAAPKARFAVTAIKGDTE